MALADRVSALARRGEERFSIDTWISDYLIPGGTFGYGGQRYPYGMGTSGLTMTLAGQRISEIANTLPGYAAAMQGCPPAFAAEMVRALVLSQVRFTFRNLPSNRSTPRRTFGTTALKPLERPDTNVTTGEMIARMEWHVGLAGNAYVYRQPDRLMVLRPDWVGIVWGSRREPDEPGFALDRELLGYVYQNGGLWSGGNKPMSLLPADTCHWAPLPDPLMPGLGMSWLTPAIRDIQGDRAANEYKLRFYEQGATPNLVVKGITGANGQPLTKPQFDEIVEMLEGRHTGVANAFRTLYLTAGMDATVVGSNFQEMDLKAIVGAGETRIAFLSRVPAPLLGIAEGLAGSSLNAGNFGMARRIFADSWVYPTLQDLCGALSTIIDVPRDAELWFDTADIPILREDGKDSAEIEQIKATTITMYVREGFTAESAIAAVNGQDIKLLKHSGKVSVQLQEPGAAPPAPNGKPAVEAEAAA